MSSPAPAPRVRTVADVLVETLVAFGITHVFGMVGHSNLGVADGPAMLHVEQDPELL
jgi:thiamine pyrophosphate-dependent acetolactate synthase large subunit-like protein